MRGPARRVLVVANPAAGLRRGRDAGAAAVEGARRAGAAVELHRTTRPGEAAEVGAQASSAGFDLVLAAGGDGTVHEVANGLAGSATALGVAPAGTMNLLARVLGLPLDPALAARALGAGFTPLRLRPGSAGGRVFVLMAGAGFDAWVLRELLRGSAGKIGFGDYGGGALRGPRTFPFPRLSVTIDGASYAAHSAIVGRAPLYGGFLRPTPHVRLDRDRLEVCALSGGRARLAALLPPMWRGTHGRSRGAVLVEAARVEVNAEVPDIPYQLDGELAGTLPVGIGLDDRPLVLATPSRD